ncbi:MAG: methyltransferase [Chloroflexota bacterium]
MGQHLSDQPSFSFQASDDYRRLREAFQRAGFRDKDVLAALGISEIGAIRGSDRGILLRRTRGGTPLETLIRLFLIEVPVDIAAAQQAIHPVKVESLVDAGLVGVEGSSVATAVKLVPFGDLFFAFDRLDRLRAGCADYVMGMGSSSITLANITIRRQGVATLDLGTGCGFQALLAASHSKQVVAVDRNPRAISLASFNARINGLDNVACLEGDLFEPVEGRTFDLVVSNPPFVISPGQRYIYRDSGIRGDEICRKIFREVPRFLREGGYCQMICNWVEKRGEDWRETLRPWFEGIGCDVWVMRSQTGGAETYATVWIRGTELQGDADSAAEFERWMAYYEEQGIEGMGLGMVTMRRREGAANWFRAEDGPDKMLGPCGDTVERGFALTDFLMTVPEDAALLAMPLQASPDIVLERQYAPSPEGWQELETVVSFRKGLVYSGKIDRFVADLLTSCDGRRPVGDILSAMASSRDIDKDALISESCRIVRQLIERGFLLPGHVLDEESP